MDRDLSWLWALKSHYVVSSKIGEGAFSTVWAAKDLSGRAVALKVIPAATEEICRRAEFEYQTMRELSHPNICSLFTRRNVPGHIILELELCGESLVDLCCYGKKLKEKRIKSIFVKVLRGVMHLHAANIAHRDLKLANILVDDEDNVKIVDFGLCCRFSSDVVLHESVGSIDFASPEVLLEQPYIGPEVDVWSLGVVLFAMVTGQLPFVGTSCWEVFQRIIRGRLTISSVLSKDCASVIRAMLCTNALQRVTLNGLTHFPWLRRHFHERSTMRAEGTGVFSSPESPCSTLSEEELLSRFHEVSEHIDRSPRSPRSTDTIAVSYLEDGSIILLSESTDDATHSRTLSIMRKQADTDQVDILQEFLDDSGCLDDDKSLFSTKLKNVDVASIASREAVERLGVEMDILGERRNSLGERLNSSGDRRTLLARDKLSLKQRMLGLFGRQDKNGPSSLAAPAPSSYDSESPGSLGSYASTPTPSRKARQEGSPSLFPAAMYLPAKRGGDDTPSWPLNRATSSPLNCGRRVQSSTSIFDRRKSRKTRIGQRMSSRFTPTVKRKGSAIGSGGKRKSAEVDAGGRRNYHEYRCAKKGGSAIERRNTPLYSDIARPSKKGRGPATLGPLRPPEAGKYPEWDVRRRFSGRLISAESKTDSLKSSVSLVGATSPSTSEFGTSSVSADLGNPTREECLGAAT